MSGPTGEHRMPASRGRRLVVAGVVGVVASVLLVVLVVNLASNPDVQSQLGDEVFEVGGAERMANRIARDNHPLLFQALAGGRDIWVNHVGPSPKRGWHAFEAHAAGQPRRCQVQWNRRTDRFRDPCTGRVYPATGEGLPAYAVDVDESGVVVVDLRRPLPKSSTS